MASRRVGVEIHVSITERFVSFGRKTRLRKSRRTIAVSCRSSLYGIHARRDITFSKHPSPTKYKTCVAGDLASRVRLVKSSSRNLVAFRSNTTRGAECWWWPAWCDCTIYIRISWRIDWTRQLNAVSSFLWFVVFKCNLFRATLSYGSFQTAYWVISDVFLFLINTIPSVSF